MNHLPPPDGLTHFLLAVGIVLPLLVIVAVMAWAMREDLRG